MPKIENIIVEYPEKGITTVSASEFYKEVCGNDPELIIRLLEGRIVERNGLKYCLNVLDIQLDGTAKAWLFEK